MPAQQPLVLGESLNLKPIADGRGKLIAIEALRTVPFEIKRVYYIYDVSDQEPRGFHAHKALQQLMFCVSGHCTLILDDGHQREEIVLDDPTKAVIVRDMTWREMHSFSDDCVLMVLASEHYDESDYIRDYAEFRRLIDVQG